MAQAHTRLRIQGIFGRIEVPSFELERPRGTRYLSKIQILNQNVFHPGGTNFTLLKTTRS